MSSEIQRLRARWVFPVAGPPIENGVVSIRGELIESVEAAGGNSAEAIDLGDVAILPGLVNAHTHLEFSSLTEPLGEPGMPFADWIRLVVAYRRSRTEAQRNQAIIAGFAECSRTGSTTIGEIATSTSIWPWPIEMLGPQQSTNLTIFLELLGLRADPIDGSLQSAVAELGRRPALNVRPALSVRLGLSPHAPYTVHLELLRRAATLSRSQHFPLAMHIAESREELELLSTGAGSLREMLKEFGAWSEDAFPGGRRPLNYLRLLADSNRALIIHGNYLDAEEIDFVAFRRDRMSIVYCPRTHERFGHSPYPLAQMLEAGALVALGTDSRASNPDLDLLAEMRHVAARHPISPATILEMGTINGAKALGVVEELGSLEAGKFADLVILQLANAAPSDPFEAIFDPASKVVSTYRRGKPNSGTQYDVPSTD